MTAKTPDPRALDIARAIQEQMSPDMVILFGSRATGDHRPDSDVDILVVTWKDNHHGAVIRTHSAARTYMEASPPRLEVNVIGMTREKFDHCRRANQHIAGQAVNHGGIMSGEKLDYGSDYEDSYPDHWPATRQCAETAQEFHNQFNTSSTRWSTRETGTRNFWDSQHSRAWRTP